MATYLTRTQAAGTSRKIFTVSMWIKKTTNSPGHEQYIFHSWNDGNNRFMVALQNDDTLQVRERASASTSLQIDTNRKFRDTNAWYHIVVRVDTTQSTAADRIRIYINGEQETSFSGAVYPTQNLDLQIGTSSHTFYLAEYGGGGNNFNGLASHWNFADGQSLAPTAFGETDATTGEWKINTSPSVSYGTNGFFILKDGNSVTDQSGNSNNFTVAGGTLTQTVDNPSNVFATMNPLQQVRSGSAGVFDFSNGNTTIGKTSDSVWRTGLSTLGMTSGKYYCEMKHNGGTHYIGIISYEDYITESSGYPQTGDLANGVAFYINTGQSSIAGTLASYGNYASSGDIIGIALDLDNNKIYFSINGTWQNSGDPTSGSTGTGALTVQSNKTYMFASSCNGSGNTYNHNYNFGNGYFGTTAVASAGTNASGNGIFEYDVPTGYTALSTKGLNL